MELRQGSLESLELNPEFWRNKRVLLTGHTGFKGSWLSLWLQSLGADLLGYSLPPPTEPNLFTLAQVGDGMQSVSGDILSLQDLQHVFSEFQPQIVFHLAAQSLVRRSYADPLGTLSTNILGTAHVLEAVRSTPAVLVVVIVTTDKCYENREQAHPFAESDRLGGFDPYSSSKAAAELVTAAYRQSFFTSTNGGFKPRVASVRAGNVIGGGDWAADRLIPDVMRAAIEGKAVSIRNPHAVRPWQHVLDPLCGYLMLAEKLTKSPRYSKPWNFGPDQKDELTVSAVLDRIRSLWGEGIIWRVEEQNHLHEAGQLRLDCTNSQRELGWRPQWDLSHALEATVKWYKAYQAEQNMRWLTLEQIQSFQSCLTMSVTPQV